MYEDSQENSIIAFHSKCLCKRDKSIYLQRDKLSHSIYSVYSKKINSTGLNSLYSLTKEEYENSIVTCDMYNVLRRGKHQKVIGYSLYGKNKFYYDKLKNLTKQINQFYPGWIMRVYYDDSIDQSIICEIECARKSDEPNAELIDNVDFCNVNRLRLKLNEDVEVNANYTHKMKWRWFPIGDSFVDIFSSRDSDSFILQREVDSVNVWLNSDKVGHIMRDHPQHGTSILGGMWGFYNERNRTLAKRILGSILLKNISIRYNSNNKSPKGADQYFLTSHVYGLIKSDSIVHDSYLCQSYGGSAFPTKRNGNCFIGNPFDCNMTASSFFQCPPQCRPKNHQDWLYC